MKTPKELRELEEKLYAYEGEDKIVSSHELAKDISLEAETENTGVPSIDRMLGGVEAGELCVVSGPSGHGKTTLLMSITRNMAYKNLPSAWFTMEVTPKAFIRKMKNATGENMPLFYMPNRNTDNQLKWVEERIIEAKVKHDVKFVFIDHVHQIFSLHKVQGNVSLELGDMVGQIKQMAIDHNIVVFLIAHMRDNADRPTAEPRKEDIRDSGLINRLADSVLMVWRIRNDDDVDSKRRPLDLAEDDIKAKVRVDKNRREGKLGSFVMQMDNGLLTELSLDNF